MSNLLKNEKILITGGTSALGEAFVHEALKRGAQIFFTYHQNEKKAKELEDKGAKGFQLDLLNIESVEKFTKNYKTEFKTLDTLIHNAAAIRDHTLKNMTEEEWDDVLNADLKAPAYLTKKLLSSLFKKREDELKEKVGGKIFFITSRVAVKGAVGVSNYAAAKAGLIGLTKSLAQELGRKNILVNAVNPGFMKSQMTRDLPEEVIEQNLKANPLGRWSDPDEVAKFLIYLVSPQMTQVTGQIFHFEGRNI